MPLLDSSEAKNFPFPSNSTGDFECMSRTILVISQSSYSRLPSEFKVMSIKFPQSGMIRMSAGPMLHGDSLLTPSGFEPGPVQLNEASYPLRF